MGVRLCFQEGCWFVTHHRMPQPFVRFEAFGPSTTCAVTLFLVDWSADLHVWILLLTRFGKWIQLGFRLFLIYLLKCAFVWARVRPAVPPFSREISQSISFSSFNPNCLCNRLRRRSCFRWLGGRSPSFSPSDVHLQSIRSLSSCCTKGGSLR